MAAGKFTQELFDSICEDISYSDKGLVSICKSKGLNANSFYEWIAKDKSLGDKYARARELQAEYMAEQIIAIADETSNDTLTNKETGNESANNEWIARSRLRVDARKWIASKLLPKKYGDKVDVTSGGEKIASLPPFMKSNESES